MKSIVGSLLPVVTIFVVAFFARWPSCGESFWLDELHTAWTVAGDWADVSPRASIGNQQTAYFDVLWFWQRLPPQALIRVYGIEAWLRLTGVLLTSLAAVVAFRIVRQRLQASPTAIDTGVGLVAAMVLALDSHAIFYGTELRPYAAIVLVSALAVGIVFPVGRQVTSMDRWWLHVTVLAAAWIHVTSLITLGWLLAVVIVHDALRLGHRGHMNAFWKSHLVPVCLWLLVGFVWLNQNSTLWQSRSNWQSFALATSPVQIWQMWSWLPLVIGPGVFWWMGPREHRREVGVLVWVIGGSTVIGYLVSKYGGIPVWHRRYYVAALPMMAVLMGLLLLSTEPRRKRHAISFGLVCLGLLLWQQGTWAKLIRGETRLARRGEDWRAAVAFINHQKTGHEPVWVDASLIEQQRFSARVDDPVFEEYFRYPVGGPYSVIEAVGVGSNAMEPWLATGQRSEPRTKDRIYLLRGRPGAMLNSRIRSTTESRTDSTNDALADAIETHSFGRITVLIQRSNL